jgi:hypothetical protein
MNIKEIAMYSLVRISNIDIYEPIETTVLCSSNSLVYINQERDKIAKEEGFTYNEDGIPTKHEEDWKPEDGDEYTQSLEIWEFPFMLVNYG